MPAQRLVLCGFTWPSSSPVVVPTVNSYAPTSGVRLSSRAADYSSLQQGPDGFLYATTFTPSVQRVDPLSCTPLVTLLPRGAGGLDYFNELAFDRGGDLFVAGSTAAGVRQVVRFDVSTGAPVRTVYWSSSGYEIKCLLACPDGSLVVIVQRDYTNHWAARIDPDTGQVLTTYTLGTSNSYVADAALHPDGSLLVAFEQIHGVRRYSYSSGAYLNTLVSPPIFLQHMAIGPDGNLVLAVEYRGGPRDVTGVREFDLRTGRHLSDLIPSSEFDGLRGMVFTQPAGIEVFGSSTTAAQPPPFLTANGPPTVGNAAFTVQSLNSPLQGIGQFVVGLQRSNVPLNVLGVDVWLDQSAPNVGIPISSNFFGLASASLAVPADPLLTGFRLYGQFIWLGTTTNTATMGVRIQVQP